MQTQYTRDCSRCGTSFTTAKPKQRFCSLRCASNSRPRLTPEERFWRQVDKTGDCWIWTGFPTNGGYGTFRLCPDKAIGAHRFSYELAHGPIPEGMWVLHNCPGGDNPACVNPDHLWLGTPAENTADMIRKGRNHTGDRHFARRDPDCLARGEKHGSARLSAEQVREMRARHAAGGITFRELGNLYGIVAEHARNIVIRRYWAHVT